MHSPPPLDAPRPPAASSFRGRWQRAREVLRDSGPRSLWFKVLGELVYRRALMCARPLDAPTARAPQVPPGVELGELEVAELDAYLALCRDADRAAIRDRLTEGQRCFVARRDGRLLHVTWTATGHAWIDYLDRELRLAPGDVYVFGSFSAPEARRSGVSIAVVEAIATRLHAEGRRRMLCIVVPENRAAVAAIPSWNQVPVGYMRTIRLGSRRWHFGAFREPSQQASPDNVYWSRALEHLESRPHHLDSFLGRMKREAHLRLVREWGALRRDTRLLKTDCFEEAAGPDAFLAELCAEAGEVWGIDLSPAVVQRARQRSRPAAVRWAVGDVRLLPFADGRFDTIVSTSTLDHFADPADLGRSLCELRRVLAPGGRLVVTLDNRQNVFDPLLRLAFRLGAVPFFVGRSCSIGELRRELASAGFEVGATTAILHNPRLVAVASVRFARWTGWRALGAAVERLLVAAQRLEHSAWRYRTGSFIAALATRPAETPPLHADGERTA
jgi:ubiquinone/menaquinone biosynthesis C-methylase UbiE